MKPQFITRFPFGCTETAYTPKAGKMSSTIHALTKSPTVPLVLAVTSDEVQVWIDCKSGIRMLNRCYLPGITEFAACSYSTTYEAVWHPTDPSLFTVVYRDFNMGIFSLDMNLTLIKTKNSYVRSITALYYINLSNFSGFLRATSIISIKDKIIVTGTGERVAYFDWSGECEEVAVCSKAVIYATYNAELSCVGVIFYGGKVGIHIIRDEVCKNIHCAFTYEEEGQYSLLLPKGTQATTLSIDDRYFRAAVGTIDGSLFVCSLMAKLCEGPDCSKTMEYVTARMRTHIVPDVGNGFNFPLTSIILLKWTNDRQAVAAGYSGGQVIVWSPEGAPLCSINCGASSRKTCFGTSSQNKNKSRMVTAMTWISSSFVLLVAVSPTSILFGNGAKNTVQSVGVSDTGSFFIRTVFLKSLNASMKISCRKQHPPVLLGPMAIYKYKENLCRKNWEKVAICGEYPIMYHALSPSGVYFAVADARRISIFENITLSWKVKLTSSKQHSSMCTGITWINDKVLISCYSTCLQFWEISESNHVHQAYSMPIADATKFSLMQILNPIKDSKEIGFFLRYREDFSKSIFLSHAFRCLSNENGDKLWHATELQLREVRSESLLLGMIPIASNVCKPHSRRCTKSASFCDGDFLCLSNTGLLVFIESEKFMATYPHGRKKFLNIRYVGVYTKYCPIDSKASIYLYEESEGLYVLARDRTLCSIKDLVGMNVNEMPIGIIAHTGVFLSYLPQNTHCNVYCGLAFRRCFSYRLAYLLRSLNNLNSRSPWIFISALNLNDTVLILNFLVMKLHRDYNQVGYESSRFLWAFLQLLQSRKRLYAKAIGRAARLFEEHCLKFLFPFAGAVNFLHQICLQYNDTASATMYVSLSDFDNPNVAHLSNQAIIEIRKIEARVTRSSMLIRSLEASDVLIADVKLAKDKYILKHAELMREHFRRKR
eukprot:g11333.t1